MIQLDNIRRIFVLGDLHFGTRGNSLVWRDDQHDFIRNFLSNLALYEFDEKTDIVVLLGDMFNNRETINVMIENTVTQVISEMSDVFKRGVFAILGNHDTYYKDNNSINSMSKYNKMFENVKIFDESEVMSINDRSVLMLPWQHDVIKIKDAASKKYDYVFAHAEISGFKYNNGMLIKNEVSKTDFLSIGKMYSGHIHKKQEFSNIVYVGTPYQLDWADVGEKKGFYILDVVDGNETFIENEISPRFVEYRLEDIMELNISEVKKLLDNNYVNLYAQGSTLRKFGVKMFLDYLIENGSTHRKIELKPIYEIVKDDNVIEVSTGMDLVSIGREFLKSKDYKEDESSDILSYFSELYSKAKKI